MRYLNRSKTFLLCALALLQQHSHAQTPAAPSVTVRWSAVTAMTDGTLPPSPVSYNVYGSHSASGPWSLGGNTTALSSVRPGVSLGLDCYTVTAVVAGVESAQAVPACITVVPVVVPVSKVPAAPTAVSVTQP